MSNTAATLMGKGRLALALEAAEKTWQGTSDRVMRLEQLKKDIAAAEDFDTAGRIKEELRKVYTLLISFNESDIQLDKAVQGEDYMEAARLKVERDETMAAAIAALGEVEQQFAGNAMPNLQPPPPPPPPQVACAAAAPLSVVPPTHLPPQQAAAAAAAAAVPTFTTYTSHNTTDVTYADQKQAGVYLEHTSSGDIEVPADLPPLPGMSVDHYDVGYYAPFAAATHSNSNLGVAQKSSQGLPQYADYSVPMVDMLTSTSGSNSYGNVGSSTGLTMADRLMAISASGDSGSSSPTVPSSSDADHPPPHPPAAAAPPAAIVEKKPRNWSYPTTSYKYDPEKDKRMNEVIEAITNNDERTLNEMGQRLGVNKLAEKFDVPKGELGKRMPTSHRRTRGVDGVTAETHLSIANNEALMLKIHEHDVGSVFAIRAKNFPKTNGIELPKKVGEMAVYDIVPKIFQARTKNDEKFDAKTVTCKTPIPIAWKGKISVYEVIKNDYKSATVAKTAAETPASTGASAPTAVYSSAVWPEIIKQEKGSMFAVRATTFPRNGGKGFLPKKIGELPIYDITQIVMKRSVRKDAKFDAIVMQGAAPKEWKGKVTLWKVTNNAYKSTVDATAEASVPNVPVVAPAAAVEETSSAMNVVPNAAVVAPPSSAEASVPNVPVVAPAAAVEEASSAMNVALEDDQIPVAESACSFAAAPLHVDKLWIGILQHEKGSMFAVRAKQFPKSKMFELPKKVGELPIYDITCNTLRTRIKHEDKFDATNVRNVAPKEWQGKIIAFKVTKNAYKPVAEAAVDESAVGVACWPGILQQEKGSTFAVRCNSAGKKELPEKVGELPIYDIMRSSFLQKLNSDEKFDATVQRGSAPTDLKGKVTVYKVTKNEHIDTTNKRVVTMSEGDEKPAAKKMKK